MNRHILICIAVVLAFVMETSGQIASLRVDSGQIVLFESSSARKSTITDRAIVSFGDSIFITGDSRATILIESNSKDPP